MNKNQNYTFQPQVVDPTPIFDQSNQALSQYIEREGIIVMKPINPNAHRNETLSFGGFKGFGYWDQGRTQKFWFGTILFVTIFLFKDLLTNLESQDGL